MNCPKCGAPCARDEVSVHAGYPPLCGPWGCACGWSEDAEYDLSEGKSPLREDGWIDQYGGLWPRESRR